MSYDPKEKVLIRETFSRMLDTATGDGAAKRERGEKPPWWGDPSHEAALFSHLSKWKHGDRRDPDSGAHPLVHLAWRALAIAYQEVQGCVAPDVAINPETERTYHDDCRPPDRGEVWMRGASRTGKSSDPDPGASDPCGRPDCEYARLYIEHGHTSLDDATSKEWEDAASWWQKQKDAHFVGTPSTVTAGSAARHFGPGPDGADELDRVRGRI